MFKETLSLLKARNKALTNAENQVQETIKALKEVETKIINRDVLIGDLKCECDKQKDLISKIKSLVNSNKYHNEKVFMNKIKELISDFDSQN
ncbi:MAG: hypothetical protein IJX99_00005 [Clostridia bacterium]|nr:hypothetical protein [Clostridia bacterium]